MSSSKLLGRSSGTAGSWRSWTNSSLFSCQDSVAWTVLTHGAHREDSGPLCEQCCRSPWIASREKGIDVERAQTVQTTVVVKAGFCRGSGLSRSTQSLSPCRSCTSQDGCLSRLLPVFQAFTPEFHGCSSGRAKRACKRSLCGYGDLSHMAMQWNSTLGLSAFSLGPCYQKAWLAGM